MIIRCIFLLLFVALLNQADAAVAAGTEADHIALRQLKNDITSAINTKNMDAAAKVLHDPFMATVITQDSFTSFEKLAKFFESLYTRDFLRIDSIEMSADADELSQIYEGTFAVTRGSTVEKYVMADGRSFDMSGRWTAITTRVDGKWKLLAIHTGTNFLDNPVLNAIEKSIIWFGAGGLAGGLLAGFGLGWFVRRRQA